MDDSMIKAVEEHLRRIEKKLNQIQSKFQQTLARYQAKADAALEIRERLAATRRGIQGTVGSSHPERSVPRLPWS